jgi:acetolactate synthase small subunit
VLDYTETRCIERELLLVKVSILGPEYLEAQLLGGPSHDPRVFAASPADVDGDAKFEREKALASSFEHSGAPASEQPSTPRALTPSEALRVKHQHLHSISTLAKQFGAKIVDVSDNSVIVEMSAKTSRVEAFLKLVEPFGVLESARTGANVHFPRSHHHLTSRSQVSWSFLGRRFAPRRKRTTMGRTKPRSSTRVSFLRVKLGEGHVLCLHLIVPRGRGGFKKVWQNVQYSIHNYGDTTYRRIYLREPQTTDGRRERGTKRKQEPSQVHPRPRKARER